MGHSCHLVMGLEFALVNTLHSIIQRLYLILQVFFLTKTGMRFALMEAKTGLAEIISKFEILPCKDTIVPIKINPRSILLTPNEPIRLLFKKI